ncbi:type II secretion system F family protein [Crateriforma spongiae]|uniref:hypothetical protein n=1 Tax=Crateriforma spongiae TaxID=2724528 RepID=UPI0014457C13|nr:hypothetical protein [Crateriforma spongiae]
MNQTSSPPEPLTCEQAFAAEIGKRQVTRLMRGRRTLERPGETKISATSAAAAVELASIRLANRRRRIAQVLYPLCVFVLTVIVFLVLNFTIIQDFRQMFSEFGLQLPAPTLLLVNLSRAAGDSPLGFLSWIVIISLVIVGISIAMIRFAFAYPPLRFFTAGSMSPTETVAELSSLGAEAFRGGADARYVADQLAQVAFPAPYRLALQQLSAVVSGEQTPTRLEDLDSLLPPSFIAAFAPHQSSETAATTLETVSQVYVQRLRIRGVTRGGIPAEVVLVFLGGMIGLLIIALMMPLVSLISGLS